MSVAEVYNKIATEFKHTRHYQWKWITDYIDELTLKDSHLEVLDIGCGSGRNILAYRNEFLKIKGLDLSHEFVKICRDQKLDVKLGDMIRIPYKDKFFDNLLVIASFHHLETKKHRIDALKEMHRILKPNGTAILSVWSKTQPEKTKRKFESFGDQMVPWKTTNGEEYFRYYYIFKLDEILDLFKQTKFKVVKQFWECGNDIFIIQKI